MGYGEYVPAVGPKLDKKMDFKIAGGMRLGPSTLIGAWLAQGLRKHLAKGSTFTMQAGGEDPLTQVATGKADLCYSTTHSANSTLAAKSGSELYTKLRAICSLPKRDWYQFVVPSSLNVSSIEEVIEKRIPLRLAVPSGSTPSGINKTQHFVLSGYGINPLDIEKWGGKLIRGESSRPHEHIGRALRGDADAVFEDGIAAKHWWDLFATREMKILPIKEEILARAHRELGYKSAIIPRGWYYGRVPDREIPTLDSSGFVVLVNEDMDDELAYLLAKCAVEYKAEIEAEFNILPVERSSLTYPLIPLDMAKDTGRIPLHKGAERYFLDKNYL
jgi:TRAP-type uncharacterized transport system substrate-binding protein